jgi:WD40 repeat protein
LPITEYCDQSHLETRERLELFVHVCQAVQHAHQKGIIHRDLKPSNVMVTMQDGVPLVKIIDFGIAKALGRELTDKTLFTGFAQLIGTPMYMSPEQAAFSNADVDTRSDTYSLGALLYELLTGTTLFHKARLRQAGYDEILRIIREEEPPRPSTRLSKTWSAERKAQSAKGVSRSALRALRFHELDWIVMKALDKDRNRRYETVSAFAADVQHYLRDEAVQACPPSTWYRLRKLARRNKVLFTTTSIVALIMLAAAATITWKWLEAEIAREKERQAKRLAQAASEQARVDRDRAVKAELNERLELGKSLLALGTAKQRTGLAGQRFTSLKLLGRAAQILRSFPQGGQFLPEARDQAITALGLTDLRVQRKRPIGTVMSIRCDARLERYAFIDFRTRDLVVRRMADDHELLRLPPPAVPFWYAHPIFSQDGRYLVAEYRAPGSEDKALLRVWRLDNKEPIFSQSVRSAAMVFLPDGRRFLFCPPDSGLAIWDLEAGKEVKRLRLDMTPYDVCLASDGRRVAVNNGLSGPPRVKVLDIETGRELASWNSHVGNAAMAWSADGQLLAIGHDDGQVFVWDVPRGRLASVLQGHTARVVDCQFAHAGHLLATYAWGGMTRLWDAAAGETLATAPGVLTGPFSPDDRRLPFSAHAKLGVWEVVHGRPCRTLHPGMIGNRTENSDAKRQVSGADFSPDGRLLAAACGDGVRLYDSDSGQELAFLPIGPCDTALFHPDGKSLISYGRTGLYRWPISSGAPAGPDMRRVGPPRLLHRANQPHSYRAAWMPGYHALAVMDNGARRVRFVDLGQRRAEAVAPAGLVSAHHRMMSIAVSPDGRWAAAGGHKERGIQIWNVPARRLERVLVPGAGAGDWHFEATFSPDGRWLVSHTHGEAPGYYFWRVGTWKRSLGIPCPDHRWTAPPAFTRDGRLMALHMSEQQILLAEAATGRAIAHLNTLQPLNPAPLAFSADGTRLVASTNQSTLLLWDLRAVRTELAERGLDWDQPAFPPSTAREQQRPSQIKVDLGNLIPFNAASLQEASTANMQAWRLATDPDEKRRDPARAVVLAQKAVKLDPTHAFYWNTLGVAHYRAGNWKKAIKALTQSMELQRGALESFDTFFLAMAHWRLGEKDQARRWYRRAVRWLEKNKDQFLTKPWQEELARFRAEAAKLLRD